MGHLQRVSASLKDRHTLIQSVSEFQKVSDSPFTESRAASASASSIDSGAHEDVSSRPSFFDRY